MKLHAGFSPRIIRSSVRRSAIPWVLVMLSACAQQGGEPGIQASERLACQRAVPTEEAACLERARTGTVIYVPERLEHPGERLERQRGRD